MKSLKIIQTLSKIGKIISKIVYICCIVGVCGCVVGFIGLVCGAEAVKISGKSLEVILMQEADMTIGTLYASIFAGLFLCIGELVISKFAEGYFDKELIDGTPFTFDGAKRLFKLGLITVCVSIGAVILAEIAQGIICGIVSDAVALSLDNSDSVGLGIAFIIISVIFKHGAEISAEKETPSIEKEDILN